MNKINFIFGLILTTLSVQLYNFLSIKNGVTGLSSICNLSSKFNCTIVESSSFSTLLGIPLSAWGIFWVITSIFLYYQGKKVGFKLWALWNILGLVFAFSYLAIMVFVIKTYCLLCLFVDLLVLSLNYISFSYIKDKYSLKTSLLSFGVGSIVSLFLIFTIDYLVYLSFKDLSQVKKFQSAPQVNLSERGELILGNPQGELVVVQYTDFQCPACKKASEIVKEVLLKNSQVKVIIKNYPLSNLCNPVISSLGHIWACNAASLAFCTQEQGRFDDFYDLAYKNQEAIKTSTDFIPLLKSKGFNLEKLSACVMNSETEKKLLADIQEGNLLNIEGTPTFYFKGKKVDLWTNTFFWKEILK